MEIFVWDHILCKNYVIAKLFCFREMLRATCKDALRESLLAYLLGKSEGRSKIKSRANAVTITAFFLFWPNHLCNFNELKTSIDGSSLDFDEKAELTEKFLQLKDSWMEKIEETLRFLAESFGKQDSAENQGTSSQADEVYVCGVKLSADLPTGHVMNIDDELVWYRNLSIQEFASCKFKSFP